MTQCNIPSSFSASPPSQITQTAAAPKALGPIRRLSSGGPTPRVNSRTETLTLQSHAGYLMPNYSVAFCLKSIIHGYSGVDVLYSPSSQTAHFGGLMRCKSAWMCPCCASNITEARRKEMMIALKKAKSLGYKMVMVTYTFSHHRGDVLKSMMTKLSKAFGRYKSGRQSQVLKVRHGVVGTIKALEVTHSLMNGWHPHIHELVILQGDADVQAFANDASTNWQHSAAMSGLDMDEHGFNLVECDEWIAEYVAKYGIEPSKNTVEAHDNGWNESTELTKWHMKNSKASSCSERGYKEHITPFGLLKYSSRGDVQAGALFVEYALAFKGLKQLHWSKGLKELFAIEEKTDEEIIDEQEDDVITMVHLSRDDWKIIVGNDCRGELLDAARGGNYDRLYQFLYDVGIVVAFAA